MRTSTAPKPTMPLPNVAVGMARPIDLHDLGEIHSKLDLALGALDDLTAELLEGQHDADVELTAQRVRAFLRACSAKVSGLEELLRLAQLQRAGIRQMAEARAAKRAG